MGEGEPAAEPGVSPASLHELRAASIWCEVCGVVTAHRILRGEGRGQVSASLWKGTARCQRCRWTHPFEVPRPSTVEVAEIVSEGARSVRRRTNLPRGRRLQVGSGVPESTEALRIRRIETRSGTSSSEALSEDVVTLWVTRDVGAVVPVSIVEGARTRTFTRAWPPDTPLEVGMRLKVDRSQVEIVGLRAVGRTWRRPGDRFPAREVGLIYARRRAMPPAGRSDWRSGRGIPSSRASSTSRSDRSRSGPGVRTTRTSPRRRTASGGAAVQRRSPS